MSRWPVDAGGVPAEWVETTVASAGQSTFVLVAGADGPLRAKACSHATSLALATGARVFLVGSRLEQGQALPDHVDDALRAYVWLSAKVATLVPRPS